MRAAARWTSSLIGRTSSSNIKRVNADSSSCPMRACTSSKSPFQACDSPSLTAPPSFDERASVLLLPFLRSSSCNSPYTRLAISSISCANFSSCSPCPDFREAFAPRRARVSGSSRHANSGPSRGAGLPQRAAAMARSEARRERPWPNPVMSSISALTLFNSSPMRCTSSPNSAEISSTAARVNSCADCCAHCSAASSSCSRKELAASSRLLRIASPASTKLWCIATKASSESRPETFDAARDAVSFIDWPKELAGAIVR
mmetsp:Transcript_7373/g.20923  ORF Transcript_7373/g.20923 Transcript_7373/m.20923 type:complete len:260 (-) Transcript_7373:630-1409(-)